MKLCTVDIIILVCFIPAVWVGLKKGLVHQLISIAVLILSVWLGFRYCDAVAAKIGTLAEIPPAGLKVISFAAIFIAVTVVLRILGWLLEKILKLATLGWMNRLVGMAFAILKCALLVCLAVLLFDTLNSSVHLVKEETLEPAVIYNFFNDAAHKIFQWIKSFS